MFGLASAAGLAVVWSAAVNDSDAGAGTEQAGCPAQAGRTHGATRIPLLEAAAAIFGEFGRRSTGARHRGQGLRRNRHDLPSLPHPGRPHHRRLPASGRSLCPRRHSTCSRAVRSPHAALAQWINLFVDFLVTKHGLAAVLHSDDPGFEALHTYFLDRSYRCATNCCRRRRRGRCESAPTLHRLRTHARCRKPQHRRRRQSELRRASRLAELPRRRTARTEGVKIIWAVLSDRRAEAFVVRVTGRPRGASPKHRS